MVRRPPGPVAVCWNRAFSPPGDGPTAPWTPGLLLFLLLAVPSYGQQRFPAEAQAVSVDVTVVDDQGRPIEGLTAAEVAVRVDGKPREVVFMRYVAAAPAPAPTVGAAAARAPAPPSWSSNAPAPARARS